MFDLFEEIDYVITNSASTYSDQAQKYEKLANSFGNVHDDDLKTSLKVTSDIFTHLVTCFKKWGELDFVYL